MEGVYMPFPEELQWLITLLMSYGYVGAFVVSFLGNLLVFVPLPYLLVILWMGSFLNPLLVGIVGGFGATVGKTVIYMIGAAGRKLLSSERRSKLDYAKPLLGKYGALAIFFFALSPLPDDILYVPLGIMRYNLVSFFISCLLGKIILTIIVALPGHVSKTVIYYFAEELPPELRFIGIFLTVLLIVVSVYVTLQLDWEKLFIKYIGRQKKS
jgi:membrane protein DedA with SNARE-associated domain